MLLAVALLLRDRFLRELGPLAGPGLQDDRMWMVVFLLLGVVAPPFQGRRPSRGPILAPSRCLVKLGLDDKHQADAVTYWGSLSF